jgi:hypothetical protein
LSRATDAGDVTTNTAIVLIGLILVAAVGMGILFAVLMAVIPRG